MTKNRADQKAKIARSHASAVGQLPTLVGEARPWPSDVTPWPDTTCPACAQRAIYSPELDRYFHADGSSNDPCWLAILRGEAA